MKWIMFVFFLAPLIGNTFYDERTKLTWDKSLNEKLYTWSNAKEYCDNLIYATKSDWILPSLDQLISLSDKQKVFPAVITNDIEFDISNPYWSSTRHPLDNHSWYVNFDFAGAYWAKKDTLNNVICMRVDK